jgi:excisionase family DNA binding protein
MTPAQGTPVKGPQAHQGCDPAPPTRPARRQARPIALSLGEMAAQLGVFRDTLYRLIQCAELSVARVGSLLRVRRPGLEAYVVRDRQGRQ